MASEGRSSESRRPRGGRNKPNLSRDNSNAGPAPTRRNSQRAPGKQEFFTDSTNTSYIPSPSPARPLAARPRQALGANQNLGGGKSFQAALRAALNNRDINSPTASPRPKLHERSQSLASAPASATIRRSPVQVSELGSPTPFRPSSARDLTRTPSPVRRASESAFPLISPASFVSESSEPPEALPEIYRQIESEEFLADATGGTDDDLSSVRSSPRSRRLKRISGSPSGLSNSVRPLSPSFIAAEVGQEEEEEEGAIGSVRLSGDRREISHLDLTAEDEEVDTNIPADPELQKDSKDEVLPKPQPELELLSTAQEEGLQTELKEDEIKAPSSGASSPFEEVVPEDPEMLARDERRVKELIQSDKKAFSKAGGRKVSFDREPSNKAPGVLGSEGSSRGSQSLSSGRDSEPSLNVPSTWGRKARSNPKWMENIMRARSGADTNLFSAEVEGQRVGGGNGAVARSVSSWLQTAAATPLPEPADSLESTPVVDKKETGTATNRQAFSKSRQWESRSSDGLLSPDKPNSPYRDRSIERLEKSAVATSRLNALGQSRPTERLGRRQSDQSLNGGAKIDAESAQSNTSNHGKDLIQPMGKEVPARKSSEKLAPLQDVPVLSSQATIVRRSSPSPEVSPTRIPRLATKGQNPASLSSQSTESSKAVEPVSVRGESGTNRSAAVTARLQRQFGKTLSREEDSGSDAERRVIQSIEEEPADPPAADQEQKSDSHDLLRRFARASSSSPAPSRIARPETRGSTRSSGSRSPVKHNVPTAEETRVHETAGAGGATGLSAVPLTAESEQILPSRDSEHSDQTMQPIRSRTTTHVNDVHVLATPAVKVGGVYTKTPKVTGGWVDTPAPTKHQGNAGGDLNHLTEKSDEASLLEAARIVMGTDKATRVEPRLRNAQDLEALTKTAPELPHSALSAIIDHAKRKNRGEEGSEGEETLQLDESTIQSLEELLIKDEELEDETTAGEPKDRPIAGDVEVVVELADRPPTKSSESSDQIKVDNSGAVSHRSEPVPLGTISSHEQRESSAAVPKKKVEQVSSNSNGTPSIASSDNTVKEAREGKEASSNIFTEGLNKLTQVFTAPKMQPSTEEQLEQLSRLSVPATSLDKKQLKQKTDSKTAKPKSIVQKASTRLQSLVQETKPAPSIQTEESSARLKKPKKAVAVLAPNEECDQAGEFHDFIWPCDSCRRRAESGKSYVADDTIGVVQWQTISVPRLWRWPSLQELEQKHMSRYANSTDEKYAMDVYTKAWLRLQTWIPRLTLLGCLVLVIGGYALLEHNVTAAFTPPFYADTMVGFGVDADAPRPPFVLLKLIWRSALFWPLRYIWTMICFAMTAATDSVGLDPAWLGLGRNVPKERLRWVFREAWEVGADVAVDIAARAQLAGQPDVITGV